MTTTKPFNLAEFLLRVKGMLRRPPGTGLTGGGRLPVGVNEVYLLSYRAKTAQGEIDLTEMEVRVLRSSSSGRARSSPVVSCWNRSGVTAPTLKPAPWITSSCGCANILSLIRLDRPTS